jgi:hypothetical protein
MATATDTDLETADGVPVHVHRTPTGSLRSVPNSAPAVAAEAIEAVGAAAGLSRSTITGLVVALTLVLSVIAPLGENFIGSLVGGEQLDRIEGSLIEINTRLDRIERAQADAARLAEQHEAELAGLSGRSARRLPASLRSIVAGDDLLRDLESSP